MLNHHFSFGEKAANTSRFGDANYATLYRKLRCLEAKTTRGRYAKQAVWLHQVPYLRFPTPQVHFLEHGEKEAILGNQTDTFNNSFSLLFAVSTVLSAENMPFFKLNKQLLI